MSKQFHFVANEESPERSLVVSQHSNSWLDAWLVVSRKIRSGKDMMPREWATARIRTYDSDASTLLAEGTADEFDAALNADTYGDDHADILKTFWESV